MPGSISEDEETEFGPRSQDTSKVNMLNTAMAITAVLFMNIRVVVSQGKFGA